MQGSTSASQHIRPVDGWLRLRMLTSLQLLPAQAAHWRQGLLTGQQTARSARSAPTERSVCRGLRRRC